MKRLAVLLIAVFAMPLLAQTASQPECDVSSLDKALDCEVGALEGVFARSANAEKAMVSKVANSTRATTPPDAFAARIHNSYQDFLVPLSFAINKVEESDDGQALTVRFNPLRQPPWNAGLTATVSKPSIADSVKSAIDEASRDTTVAAIQKQLGDFDDVTVALSFTRVTEDCKHVTDRCFGRNPRTYWNLASGPVLAVLPEASSGASQAATADLFDVVKREIERTSQPRFSFKDKDRPPRRERKSSIRSCERNCATSPRTQPCVSKSTTQRRGRGPGYRGHESVPRRIQDWRPREPCNAHRQSTRTCFDRHLP